MPRLAVRPLVFRTIILLTVFNAVAGIFVIVSGSGQIGDTEANVLETTGLLSLAALLLLPCVLAHEAGRPKPFTLLPSFAVSCLLIGFSLGVYLVWTDPTGDTVERISLSFGLAGGGLAHVCLISLVRARRAVVVVLQALAVVFTAAMVAMIIGAIWTDLDDADIEDWRVRTFIVTAILAAATSLLVPVVNLLLRSRPLKEGTPSRASYCPNCAAVLHMEEPRCLACGARFRVEFFDA